MGASFAKAIFHRVPKRLLRQSEADWTLGWTFPIKTDADLAGTCIAPSPESLPLGDPTIPFSPSADDPNPEDRS
jgi:hypothetical protein